MNNSTLEDWLEIDELDLILSELQNYMVNVPATMKAKQAITDLIKAELNKFADVVIGEDSDCEHCDDLRQLQRTTAKQFYADKAALQGKGDRKE